MKINDLCRTFLEVERKENLFGQFNNIDNIPLWSLIRFPIWSSIILVRKLELSQSWSSYRDKSLRQRLLPGLNLIKGAIYNNPFRVKRHFDFMFLGIGQREYNNGKYIDIYMDYLINAYPEDKSISFIKTGGEHYYPLATKNYRYFDTVNLKTLVKSFITRKNKKVVDSLSEILNLIQNKFDIKLNYDKILGDFYYDKILNYLQYQQAFDKILDNIKPKIIFENDHYGIKSIAVNIIASRKNIPTIEMQHGMINQYHMGYNYSNLKTDDSHEFLPKYIFLFGKYWKKNCLMPLPEKNKIPTGFPHFESKRNLSNQVNRNPNQILVLSQGLIGVNLSEFIIKLAKKLPSEYNIIYKLHPAEYHDFQEKYSKLLKLKNVEIAHSSNSKNLYEYFAESTFQIGVYSTALYEGIAFGLKTFTVKLPGYEFLLDLIKAGYIKLVSQVEEVLDDLKYKGGVNTEAVRDLWEDNAITNMKSEINRILEKDA
jgi:hypothetical protein